jgi:unsaturated pyranuronate lyase
LAEAPEVTHSARVVDWDAQDFEEVRPRILGATIDTPRLTATLYRYAPGSSWEEHRHPEDQITTVLRGTIEFVVDGKAITLTEGQLAALPGGTPHSATAGAGGAETLNVFTSRARRGD